jgi:hypothetical protein
MGGAPAGLSLLVLVFHVSHTFLALLRSMLLEKNDQRNLLSPQGRDHEI